MLRFYRSNGPEYSASPQPTHGGRRLVTAFYFPAIFCTLLASGLARGDTRTSSTSLPDGAGHDATLCYYIEAVSRHPVTSKTITFEPFNCDVIHMNEPRTLNCSRIPGEFLYPLPNIAAVGVETPGGSLRCECLDMSSCDELAYACEFRNRPH